jgi:phosphoesterase RecJ-like protein
MSILSHHVPQIDAVIDIIKHHDSIAIISHYNPDSDAYGSSIGLALSLQAAGKHSTIINESGIVDRYESLPGMQLIQKNLPLSLPLVIACDCGAIKRVGDSQVPAVKSGKQIINIDHHVSNEMFGTTNLVIETASSTSEIIYELLERGSFPITEQVASLLMAGIIGDTGSFRYSATSARTFEIGAALMRAGAVPFEIHKNLYANPLLGAVRLQAESMMNLTTDLEGAYAEIVVTAEMIKRHQASLDDTDGLAERGRDIRGVKISAALRQDGPLWRVSLRSISEQYDVSKIAQSFGGGGHKQAAAFRITQPLSNVQQLIRTKVKEALDALQGGS